MMSNRACLATTERPSAASVAIPAGALDLADDLDLADAFAQHRAQLSAVAFRLLGDQHQVDDALQDAYVRAHRSLARFRGDAAVSSWLYRIVYTTCIDQLRRRRSTECLTESASSGPSPDEIVVDRIDLRAGLAELAPGVRQVVVLVDALGFDYIGAGEMLGVPTGTIASRLHRGRAALRHGFDLQAA